MSSDDVDDELEELREQTDPGTRLNDAGDDPDDEDDLKAEIVALLHAIDDSDVSKTLSLRDERLTALVRALEETGDLDDVGTALQDELGRDPDADAIDRSHVLRLAVRVGLAEAAPESLDTAREAHGEYASEQF